MIKLENIHKIYELDHGKTLHALKGIDLQINKGEIFGVIGLSGAGKSTLIRIINMLELPTDGKVIIDGEDITSYREAKLRKVRQSIGMIFQQFNLLSSKTVFENVAFPLELDQTLSKDEIKKRVHELLKMVELDDKSDVYPAQLSGGQKQRVGIARALATNPKILLCDEATSALDPKTTSSILKLLTTLRDKLNLTIVIITHQLEVIKECCDRVAVIDGGLISEMGNTIDLFANPQKDLTKRLVSAVVRKDLNDLLEYTKLDDTYSEGSRAWFELLFLGDRAEDPVIVEVAKELNVNISILAGQINHIQNKPLGILIVAVKGDEALIQKAKEELEKRVYHVQLLGYEVENNE
ncbi:methionine ABC transporter ATP-binding protein [Succinivibrio dextrinosolvens]|uniref:methionine ABC transporter ATP-binding protein n=1 Tax=Succinivibrio dextrinosolvens TaxID=83771 RepID=UPI0004E24D9C|nr:ATP-binding cassette domain-containing protein [Succinivibrio dextrinosolvens]